MPHVYRVRSLLKRWVLGTHQGGISNAHLPHYVDGFAFRFNRRTSGTRGLLFYRLLPQPVHRDPIPTTQLFRNVGRGPGKGRRHNMC